MDGEINNVIYMELNSGPKIANSTCGKTIIAGTIDRDSTVQKCVVNIALVSFHPELDSCISLVKVKVTV